MRNLMLSAAAALALAAFAVPATAAEPTSGIMTGSSAKQIVAMVSADEAVATDMSSDPAKGKKGKKKKGKKATPA